jgi:hypothetical protein
MPAVSLAVVGVPRRPSACGRQRPCRCAPGRRPRRPRRRSGVFLPPAGWWLSRFGRAVGAASHGGDDHQPGDRTEQQTRIYADREPGAWRRTLRWRAADNPALAEADATGPNVRGHARDRRDADDQRRAGRGGVGGLVQKIDQGWDGEDGPATAEAPSARPISRPIGTADTSMAVHRGQATAGRVREVVVDRDGVPARRAPSVLRPAGRRPCEDGCQEFLSRPRLAI